MATAIFRGAISFGLVSIPIRVLAATESHDVAFRQVHLADLGRVRTRKVCELDGRELSQDEIGKGYETDHGVIALTDTELDSLPLPTAKAIEIEAFIDAGSIDPLQMSTGYYLATDGPVAAKPYVLLRKALERSSKIAIAKFAFHGRERLGMLRVLDDVIVLQGLRWDDEIRSPASIAPPPSSLTDDEIKAGIELLETLAQDDVRNLSDHYREALEELLIAKTEHRKPVPVGGTQAEPAGQVVDLMAALNASVEAAKASRGETGTADGSPGTVHAIPKKRTAKTVTAKKTPAKKTQPARRKPKSA